MKNLYLLLLNVLILSCYTLPTNAQNPEWLNYTYTESARFLIEEGDFIWAGTERGLFKLSKASGEIKEFYNVNNSGLPSNKLSCMAIDASGTKWIGTDYGLVKFDGVNWTVYNELNSGLPDREIRCIAIDSSGTKWIGAFFNGLIRFDGSVWNVYKPSESILSFGLFPDFISIDNIGNIWIAAYELVKFKDYNWTVYHVVNIRFINTQENGKVWLGTSNGMKKLEGSNITVYDTSNSGIPDNWVSSVLIDHNGDKWIGTSFGGLAKFDDVNWTVYNNSNSGLPGNKVASVIEDKNYNLWIGTNYPGKVVKFNGSTWNNYEVSNSGLPSNFIRSLIIDKNNIKWMTTDMGLVKFDGINWTVYNSSNSGLPFDYLWGMAIDSSGNKWIAGYGVAKFNDTTWTLYNTSNSGLAGNDVNFITVDQTGNIWISGNGEGNLEPFLNKFDGTNWTVYNKHNSGLKEGGILSMAFDSTGTLWIGNDWWGLTKFDGTNWTNYDHLSGYPLVDVYCVTFDANGIMWLGTNYGVTKYDGTNFTYNILSDNSRVWSIAIDKSNNKWIGTDDPELAKYDGENWTFYTPYNSPLLWADVNNISIDRYGNKWLLSQANGVVVFNEGGLVPVADNKDVLPSGIYLSQNYPNPFNPSTNINFQLPNSSHVIIEVFDILGRSVVKLIDEYKKEGSYSVNFNAGNLASGIYYYQIRSGNFISTKKMILIK